MGDLSFRSTAVEHPTVYSAAADFSLASNPNGVWSYGYEISLGSSFQLYDAVHAQRRWSKPG